MNASNAPGVVVACDPAEGGWRCRVTVGDGLAASEHEVILERETLDDLAPGVSPDTLVAESFAFLLEREPRDAIMRRFELPIIGRYFGDYPEEIRRRLGG